MGDSPFQAVEAHQDAQVRSDIEQDLKISRRKLDFIITRFRDAADAMRGIPYDRKAARTGFTEADIAGLCREITRLESVSGALINAGF
jgi:hypothetical protein